MLPDACLVGMVPSPSATPHRVKLIESKAVATLRESEPAFITEPPLVLFVQEMRREIADLFRERSGTGYRASFDRGDPPRILSTRAALFYFGVQLPIGGVTIGPASLTQRTVRAFGSTTSTSCVRFVPG